MNAVGSLCGYLRQRYTEGENEGFPGRDKDRRDGMESSGHRKTQRGTRTWEPEKNRSTHTQNVKLGEARPSLLGAHMASDPQRLKLDF